MVGEFEADCSEFCQVVGQELSRRPANEEPVLEHRGFLTTPEYARRIRTGFVLACALLLVAGCGGSSSSSEGPPPAAGTTTVTAPTTTVEQTDPLAGAGTSVVVAPSSSKATALLERDGDQGGRAHRRLRGRAQLGDRPRSEGGLSRHDRRIAPAADRGLPERLAVRRVLPLRRDPADAVADGFLAC